MDAEDLHFYLPHYNGAFRKGTRDEVILRDCLHNFHPTSGASDEYCKGLLVGCVSGLMAGNGGLYPAAIAFIKENMPRGARPLTEANCPESWLDDMK